MESGIGMGNESGMVIGVVATAFAFGIVYDRVVAYLERSGRARGYTALLVIGGVFISLALAAFLVGLEAFLITLVVFALTGVPMAMGSFWRHTDERRRDDEQLRQVMEELRADSSLARDVLDEIRVMRRMTGDDGRDSA